MYGVIKGVVWATWLTFPDLIFWLMVISLIVHTVALKSYGVKWWLIGMIPFSHNVYKLYLQDTLPIPWYVGFLPALLGFYCWAGKSPLGTVLYLCINVAINYLYGLSMYDTGIMFALIPFRRYYVQIREAITSFKEKSVR